MSTTTSPTRPTLAIRPATSEDYDEIGRITVESYLAAGHFTDPEHAYLKFVREVAERHAAAEILVAERAGQVIGAVTLVQAGNRYADIALAGELEFRMLVVDPAAQRSGAGRALVDAVIARARELDGVHTVSLTTGAHWVAAQGLYEGMGFRRATERDWYVPNTDILLVVYTLAL